LSINQSFFSVVPSACGCSMSL